MPVKPGEDEVSNAMFLTLSTIVSRQCCIPNQNQLLGPMHILLQKYYSRKSMME
ncbi:hypothetical protein IFM89_036416, partial [Coptis chinensis]